MHSYLFKFERSLTNDLYITMAVAAGLGALELYETLLRYLYTCMTDLIVEIVSCS